LEASFERSEEANPSHHFAVGRKAQEKERHTVSVFEILSANCSFNAVISVDPFGLVEVALPQVRSFQGVMALKSHSGRLVDETRTVPVAPTS
jgi:hypothetical protein